MNKIIGKQEQNTVAKHPLQSWEWGEARASMGISVEKIISSDKIFQCTIHPIPFTPFSIAYIPRSELPNTDEIQKIITRVKKYNCIFIKLEPYVSFELANQWAHASLPFSIRKSTHPLFPEWTQTINLSQSVDKLLSQMKPKTRYNIRLAEKKGVVVKEESTDHGFEVFANLYFETCRRQKYKGHTFEYHKKVWDNLKNSISHIFTAYYQEKPLASYQLFVFKERLYYVYGGSSLEEKNRMAANLLMWESIQLGKKLGATSFDMWGSLSPNYNTSDPWAGFTRFKEGYGTSFVHLSPSWDIVLNTFAYKIYSLIYRARSMLLKFSS